MNRRSLTPPTGVPILGLPAQRRGSGGARHEITARVTLRSETREVEGWALNISRGGIRVVTEDPVELGEIFEVREHVDGAPSLKPHRARVVWLQDEPDGAIAGLEFLDVEPSVRPSSPSVPSAPPIATPEPSPSPPADPAPPKPGSGNDQSES